MRSTKAIRIAKTSYIILSALFIVLGVGLIALRDLSVSLIGVAAGVMLIAFGIVKLIGYFSKDLYRLAFQFDLSLGLMLAVLGVIILRNPDQAMSFLCLMLGIATMADGLIGAGRAPVRPEKLAADPDAGRGGGRSGRAADAAAHAKRACADGAAGHRHDAGGRAEPVRGAVWHQDHPTSAR